MLAILLCAGLTSQLIGQFARTPLVFVGEVHRNRVNHDFLRALIADPRFAGTVQDVVVEFGNALYQDVADRYVLAGEDVPANDLRRIWRDTGQWLVWDSPLYEQFFAHVRAVNRKLPRKRRIRVVLGDPPLDWSRTQTADDYRKFADRDAFFAQVTEREVLAKGHKALLIAGEAHLPKAAFTGSTQSPGAGALLAKAHPRDLFVAYTLLRKPPFPVPDPPALIPVAGTPLGAQSFKALVPPGVRIKRAGQWVPASDLEWPPVQEMIDALVWLGDDAATVDPDPALYRRDRAYAAELRRRAGILKEVYGIDFLPELERLLAE